MSRPTTGFLTSFILDHINIQTTSANFQFCLKVGSNFCLNNLRPRPTVFAYLCLGPGTRLQRGPGTLRQAGRKCPDDFFSRVDILTLDISFPGAEAMSL